MTRHSGATLLWGLAGFVALQLGLLASIQWWTPEFRDPFYAYKARQLRGRTVGVSERPLTVVMLGSSRTTFGLKGGALEPRLAEQAGRPVAVFNFGLTGAGPL